MSKILIQKIAKELHLNCSSIQLGSFTGQDIRDGKIIIGTSCGPDKDCAYAVLHELAHFVEIDEDRMQYHGWGLRVPLVYVLGHECVEPTTCQITERELRVHAYQAHLHEYFGEKEPIEDCVNSLRHLCDVHFVPLEDGSLPYSGKSNLSYNDTLVSQQTWRMRRVQELKKTFTLERFFNEYWRRFHFLERQNSCPQSKQENVLSL